MRNSSDAAVLRDLAKQYMETASKPIQQERRELWAKANSKQKTRVPILATYGMWNVWCREVFGDESMKCQDSLLRQSERWLRMQLFHDTIGDDFILEPWLPLWAQRGRQWGTVWGVKEAVIPSDVEGGAWHFNPVIKDWSDVSKLSQPWQDIDEQATQADYDKLQSVLGDIIEINIQRNPMCYGFMADISTCLARLRGLEQLMIDMYESPRELHKLLAFMRDGVLAQQQQGEDAGDWNLADQDNQSMPYCLDLPRPKANARGARRSQMWTHCAAQEYTLISPAMHEEFLLQYQLPIISNFGVSAYGCCEDLTNKIGMLRKIPNLRIISVTPLANVKRCAEQIGTDYVMSWRPNPTDMVCCGYDEGRVRRIIGEGMEACKDGYVQIHLKDVETVEGDPTRLARWVKVVREVTEKY